MDERGYDGKCDRAFIHPYISTVVQSHNRTCVHSCVCTIACTRVRTDARPGIHTFLRRLLIILHIHTFVRSDIRSNGWAGRNAGSEGLARSAGVRSQDCTEQLLATQQSQGPRNDYESCAHWSHHWDGAHAEQKTRRWRPEIAAEAGAPKQLPIE